MMEHLLVLLIIQISMVAEKSVKVPSLLRLELKGYLPAAEHLKTEEMFTTFLNTV